MYESRLAVLAATLLLLKWCPKGGLALPEVRQTRRRRPAPPAADSTVFMLATPRPAQPGDFGRNYPQAGRFTSQHKTGQRQTTPAVPEIVDDAWGFAILSRGTSTDVALSDGHPEQRNYTQSQLFIENSHHANEVRQEIGYDNVGCGSCDSASDLTHRQQPRRKTTRRRQQHERQQHERQHVNMQRRRSLGGERLLAQFRVKICTNTKRLLSWMNAGEAGVRRRVRPLLLLEPSQLLQRMHFEVAGSVESLASWGGSRGHGVGTAAREARAGLQHWRNQRAVQMAELRVVENIQTSSSSLLKRLPAAGVSLLRQLATTGGRRSSEADKDREVEGEYHGSRLRMLTDKIVQNIVDVVARDGWEHVATTNGVVVYRQYIALGADGVPSTLEPLASVSGGNATTSCTTSSPTEASSVAPDDRIRAACDTPQFACVKATAILNVPPGIVYRLFSDNSRVGEYNEHCQEVADLETLSEDSKITWAASGRMGPFKARDFCTLVHFRTLSDGTLAQVSRPVEHPAAPRSSKYVRSEILLAGNFMRPVPGDPSRTEFLMVTHVNPGGAAQTRAGAMLVNSLCTSSPVNFIRRLEAAAQRLMHEMDDSEGKGRKEDDDLKPSAMVTTPTPMQTADAALRQDGPAEAFQDEEEGFIILS